MPGMGRPEAGAEEFKASELEAENALKKENRAVDLVHHAGATQELGNDTESQDVQFPQDVLFTNVNSSRHIGPTTSRAVAAQPTELRHDRMILPNGNEENYLKLKLELEDSNVYFLNPLRREIDREEQFSRLYTDQKNEHD